MEISAWLFLGILLVVLISFLICIQKLFAPKNVVMETTKISKCDHCEKVAAVWGSVPNCSDCPYERGSSIVGDDLSK
jgi:hypothetical protein